MSGQETTPKLFKGRNARQHPIVEVRDTAGTDPFSVAARVELWYYNDRMRWWGRAFPNGRVNLSADSIRQRVVLDSALRNGFCEALYVNQLCDDFRIAGCYLPRDLLVFYGAEGRVLGCIEICVECAGGYVSDGLRSAIFCPERTSTLGYWLRRSYDQLE